MSNSIWSEKIKKKTESVLDPIIWCVHYRTESEKAQYLEIEFLDMVTSQYLVVKRA